MYVRVVIIWISVRSAGYATPAAPLCVGGGLGPPVGALGQAQAASRLAMGSVEAAAATRARPPTQYCVRPTSASQRPGLPQSRRQWMPCAARAAAAVETVVIGSVVGG